MAIFNNTKFFEKDEFNNEKINIILNEIVSTLQKKDYDVISQLMGYIKTGDPVFIPRDNNSREKIRLVKTDEILEYLIRYYVNGEKINNGK